MNHIYQIYTTVDITPTGVVSTKYKNVNNYELKRNQQRNYDTLIQVLSLRTNIEDPTVEEFILSSLESKLFTHLDQQSLFKVWQLSFTCDRYQVFGEDNETLINDLHMVPIVPALTETTPVFPPYFLTHGDLANIKIFYFN